MKRVVGEGRGEERRKGGEESGKEWLTCAEDKRGENFVAGFKWPRYLLFAKGQIGREGEEF